MIPGLTIIPEFISQDEEKEYIDQIDYKKLGFALDFLNIWRWPKRRHSPVGKRFAKTIMEKSGHANYFQSHANS